MINPARASNTAWRFLRKNPAYIENWHARATSAVPQTGDGPFDLHAQSHSDRTAHKWGLFAYADPMALPHTVSPFWSITPTLEGEIVPNGKPALLPMLQKSGAVISGLLLLGGDLILKVEHKEAAVQMRIKDGKSFDETSALTLRLPLDLMLPVRLIRSMDIWNIAAGEGFKKPATLTTQITMNFCSSLMAFLPARAIAG